MSIEAMKRWLEALEKCRYGFEYTRQYVGYETLPAIKGWSWYDGDVAAQAAIEEMRQAIEQAEQAQQKQCLMGGQCKHGSWCSEVYCQEHCEFVEQAEQAQPVGEVLNERGEVDWISFVPPVGTSLYTAPPPRKPLTEDEIGAILDDPNIAEKHQGNWLVLPYAYARAIEAKLKEKNT
jgi:hypothetical protein